MPHLFDPFIVMLATKMLDDPYWPLHAARELHPDNPHHMPPPYDYVLNPPKKAHHQPTPPSVECEHGIGKPA